MRPVFRITADSVDVTDTIARHLVSLSVDDSTGITSDILKFTLADPLDQIATPRKGAKLKLSIGYAESRLVSKGGFTVDTVVFCGPPSKIDITARGANFRRELRTPKTRSWHEKTLGEILKTVAKEHNLEPKIPDDLANVFFSHIDQTEESDIHLLTRLANDLDAVAKPVDTYLMIVDKAESKTASGKAMPVIDLTPSDVTGWTASFPDRDRFGSAAAVWINLDTAAESTITVGDDPPLYTIRRRFPSLEIARHAATAALKRLNRRNAKCSLTLPGNPVLAAECKLNLTGFRPGVNGLWIIKKVSHQIAASYTCRVECEPART